MGKTSWEVKAKYNSKHYRNFSTRIKHELFEQIDNYCKENNLSRSQFLKLAIDTLEKED